MSFCTESDALTAILNSYRLDASIYARPAVCGEWRIGSGGDREHAVFHLVGSGSGWLHFEGGDEPVPLRTGDLVLMPTNPKHTITPGPERPDRLEPGVASDAAGPVSSFLCGQIRFLVGRRNPLVQSLPELLVVPADEGGARLATLARLMGYESDIDDLGSEIVLNKLADVLFLYALRHYIDQAPARGGLLAGLADARLRRALEAIHNHPDEKWSVETLAREAGMSRTAFSNRFAELLGESPIAYLGRYRMDRAQIRLASEDIPIAALSAELGYETEAAFRKAFKRLTGETPGEYRKRAKA